MHDSENGQNTRKQTSQNIYTSNNYKQKQTQICETFVNF